MNPATAAMVELYIRKPPTAHEDAIITAIELLVIVAGIGVFYWLKKQKQRELS